MRIVIPLLMFLGLATSCASHANEGDFWLVDEFFQQYPEQHTLSQAFAEQVRQAPIPIKTPPIKPVTIAVVYPANQISDYWRRSIRSFEARLTELGIPYEITPFLAQSTSNAALKEHAKDILNAVNAGTDYLVLTLYKQQHQAIIERLIADKKTKIILQNITTPIKSWGNQQPFMYVGFDHAEGTQLLANWYMTQPLQSHKYGLMHFPRGYISQLRGDTFIDLTQKASDYQLVSSYYTDSSRQHAHLNAKHMLNEDKDLGFIYASSTDIALGVSDAIAEHGLQNKILVNGWGGGSAELEALLAKRLDVTVMRMNDDNGVAMAEAIKLDLSGQRQQVPVIYRGDFVLVSKEATPEEILSLKRRAFRYSGVEEPILLRDDSNE